MSTYQLDREKYARIYGCTPRSISNYERDEAPLDDPEAMYHWLWHRRSQPEGFRAMSLLEVIREYERHTVSGEDVGEFLFEEIREKLIEMDVAKMILVCKFLSAEKKGYIPPYREAVTASMGKIRDAIEEARRIMGIPTDADEDEEGEDDDSEAEDEEAAAELADSLV